MIEPEINVDVFRHRPVREVVALMPDLQTAVDACRELQDAGIEITGARILDGPEGTEIFDVDGDQHDFRTRAVRAMQKIGYDESYLAVYDEGLRDGLALLTLSCSHDVSLPVAATLQARGGRAIVWFGRGLSETLSPP